MGLDQGQGQLSDFANKSFEAAVFLSPLLGLGNQIHRNVSGMGFSLHFPGQIMAQVFLPAGAAAIGVAASAADGDETGGQHWAFGLELLLASLQEPADQGGMFRDFHELNIAI